jgi:hypothetical protein
VIDGYIQGGIARARTPSANLTGSVLTATQLVDLESQQINILLDHKSVMPFGFRGGISVGYK